MPTSLLPGGSENRRWVERGEPHRDYPMDTDTSGELVSWRVTGSLRSTHRTRWIKGKNPNAPSARREAAQDWES